MAGLTIGLDFTIVNTSLTEIQTELQATLVELQWVIAGFGLLFSTLVIIMGRLGDLFGRRKFLLIGIVGFGLASLGCGLAQTPMQLIAFRILQGLFAAACFPNGIALISKAFQASEQGRALGLYTAVIGIGLAFGPVIGSLLVNLANWRWIFLINVPIIAISYIICSLTIIESKIEGKYSIDYLGGALCIITLVSFTFAIMQSPVYGWSSPIIIGTLLLGILSTVLLIWVEKKAEYPLLPVQYFKNTQFIIGTINYSVSIGFSWVILFMMPLYLHSVYDFSIAEVGFSLLAMTLMTILIPPVAGKIYDQYGTKLAILLTQSFIVIGLFLFLFFSSTLNLPLLLISFLIFGIGWSFANGVSMPVILSGLKDKEHVGLVSGAAITVLNVVGVISLAVCGTIFQAVQKSDLYATLTQSSITLSTQQETVINRALSEPEKLHDLLKGAFSINEVDTLLSFFRNAFVGGFHAAMLLLLILSVLCLMTVVWIMRKNKSPK